MANSSSYVDLSNNNYQGASDGIIKIINAMADAKTSQTNLQKEVMLDHYKRQNDLADKNAEQQNQMNNWAKMFDPNNDPSAPSNIQGQANSQTPSQVGSSPVSPIGGAMPQGGYTAQQPPPMSMADGSNQQQVQQMQQQAQVPVQQTVVAPIATQSNQPESMASQINSLGFKPVGVGQIAMSRQGKPEPKDYAYISALNKAKQGNASPGEIQLIKDYNGMSKSDLTLTREQNHQDQLENQAIQRLTSVRGDAPMAKIETQRDAAISAYNTLQTADSEKRPLNQIEYLDVLGQLWKARTGAAPTEQVLKEFNIGTMQQKINRLGQFFTGTPNGANTDQVISALKDFVKTTGKSLDQTHDGYFQTHAIKPTGLNQSTWDELSKVHRGNSFQEGIDKYKDSLNSNTYGGLTIADAKAKGYKEFNPKTQEWR